MSAAGLLKWRWPTSLFGRISLILFSGLAAAHLLTAALLLYDRAEATGAMMIDYVAQDVSSAVAILERLPADERAQWLPKLNRPNYRYSLDVRAGNPATTPAVQLSTLARAVAAAIANRLPGDYAIAAASGSEAPSGGSIRLSLRLKDGTPLTIEIAPPSMAPSTWLICALAVQAGLLATAAWLAVGSVTHPLARLAEAVAKDDGRFAMAPGTSTKDGPEEVVQLARALDAMRQRLRRHHAERVHMLAAISHDLQTPLTRMRLRLDLLSGEAARAKLQSDLAEMQALVRAGLEFARNEEGREEPLGLVDLQALVESLIYDYADAGQKVALAGRVAAPFSTRPLTLRRLLSNLLDNALKFGSDVELKIDRGEGGRLSIAISDRGPGIPDDELSAVRQPYYRLEQSRNRDSGGIGLGLAIADQLARKLGGDLTLTNRPEGGLRATLTLHKL